MQVSAMALGGPVSASASRGEVPRVAQRIRAAAGALVFTAAAAMAAAQAAWADPSAAAPVSAPSALSHFLESNAEAVEALRTLLYDKLDGGELREGLRILDKLIAARPDDAEWRFLAARVHDEMGDLAGARRRLEEVLAADPLSTEALLQIAVVMDRAGEGAAAAARLEAALLAAKESGREKEARDVRLVMAQLLYLQKRVDEAISCYEELAEEDPRDYRPFFCQGVIYSLLDRNEEAREKFAKFKELSPRKFDVEGYLQTPLSRLKLFGAGDGPV
ncbi:protein SLOW GREEN 1, chloroplastic-like [Wolffia australiana]